MLKFIKKLLKRKVPIPFGQGFYLTELPVCTFHQGDKLFNFLLDTGSNNNLINAEIKNLLLCQDTEAVSTITGAGGNIEGQSPVSQLTISYKGQDFTDYFVVADLSEVFGKIKRENGVTVHGIIGSKFFHKYQYVLDFQELIAYSKK